MNIERIAKCEMQAGFGVATPTYRLEEEQMSLCNDCRHLIDIIDSELVCCEAHRFSVKGKRKCDAYLSAKCKDKRKIEKSNREVEKIQLKEYEDMLG